MDACAPTETFKTDFSLVATEKATRYYMNFTQNFTELFEYLEKFPIGVVPNISSKEIVLNLSEHYNYTVS